MSGTISIIGLLIYMGWATFFLPSERPVEVSPPTIEVMVTAYTCDDHPSNPMKNCGSTRWGVNPYTATHDGAACPPEWKDWEIQIEGIVYRCDDTGLHNTLYDPVSEQDIPHVDIRVATYEEALQQSPEPLEAQVVRTPQE